MVKIMQNGPALKEVSEEMHALAAEFEKCKTQMYDLIHDNIVMEDNEDATWFGPIARETRQKVDGYEPTLISIKDKIDGEADSILNHAQTWGSQL